jgi:hypothetical protein
MEQARQISWEDFRSNMLEPGLPAALSLGGSPPVHLFVSERSERIGIRVEIPAASSPPRPCPVQQITIRQIREGRKVSLEMSTTVTAVFREFFYLALSAADLIRVDGLPPDEAMERAIIAWRSLLRSAIRMSEEEVLGLIGELWLLHRLIATGGGAALTSWTAPRSEPHDFRMEADEIEVKVTRRTQRIHLISGLGQLVPSQGLRLSLLSLQLEPAGGGEGLSLPGIIAGVRELLRPTPTVGAHFEQMLATRAPYRDGDADLYADVYRLRSPALLVPVNESCPRLHPALVQEGLGPVLAPRIGNVMYEVNVDGLGQLDGSESFLRLVPAAIS